jgi:hypothetical protein
MSDLTCTNCGEYVGSPIADRIEELEDKLAKALESQISLRTSEALKIISADAQILRWIAEGYDKEDAALIGEPDPWALDDAGDIGDAETWQAERIVCARSGLLHAVKRTTLAELKGEDRG